jgi:isoleucyl-tRNA synthetase
MSQPITEIPTTEIPNRFDFSQQASAIYAAWEAAGCFDAEIDNNKQPYTIVIPPPNVTGALHLGHALNNTLQDARLCNAMDARNRPCWNCDPSSRRTQTQGTRK